MTDELHGLRTSAGMLLSKYLRQIAGEQTEVEGNDPKTGNARVVSKAEALARVMWKLALGWEEEQRITDPKSGQERIITKAHKPDNTMIALIWDRLEGRTGTGESEKTRKEPLSKQVDEQIRQRVNALARGDSEEV